MSEQDQDKPPEEVPVSEPESSPSEPEGSPSGPEGSPTVEAAAEPEPPKEEKPPWLLNPQVPQWQDEDDDPTAVSLRTSCPGAVLSARSFAGDLILVIRREQIAEVAECLKNELGFGYMVDIAGADYPDREERFEVVYHFYAHSEEKRIRLKVSTADGTSVPTVSHLWPGANWPEREVFDMYGIRFEGHPDMTRILTWEGFNGHPLRKEFPVEGIDTGAAIYPEYYDQSQGPISGDGTGWKVPEPPEEPVAEEAEEEGPQGDGSPAGGPAENGAATDGAS